jgi:hypothetical protein
MQDAWERRKMNTNWGQKLKERYDLEGPVTDARIELKLILNRMGGRGLNLPT